jgi:hypothetical protein
MAHCGFEATAVEDMLSHPLKGLMVSLRGPRVEGDMVAEPVPEYVARNLADIPVKVDLN